MHLPIFTKFPFLISLTGLALASSGSGSPPDRPEWWFDGSPSVIAAHAPEDNQGPANIGQAKWMVSEALRALDTWAPAVAYQIRADLATSHPGLLTVSLYPKPDEWVDKQKAPLLIGQLKAIAHPFYNRLNEADELWVLEQIQLNHTADSAIATSAVANTHYWQVATVSNYQDGYYPWNPSAPADQNKAITTIGQLKAVFSLRFDSLPSAPSVDTDGDGAYDSDEIANGTDPNDYYNGQTPVITIISGSGQTTLKNERSPAPIVFQVSRGGIPLVNAPVQINHPEGLGVYINPNSDTIYGTSMTLRTDSQGKVFAYFKAN